MRLRSALPALAALLLAPALALAQGPSAYTLVAPDGQEVHVTRDEWGVPHVTGESEAAAFFGQGFAVAQDRLFQMETFWRTATGRLAELQGPAALDQDRGIRTVLYTPDERAAQFAALSAPVQEMMEAYVAGINAYIDSTAANPGEYLPAQYALGGFAPERWDLDKAVAVLQFFMRRFGEIGGDELTRLAELQAQGPDWFEANRPVNDPGAATTIDTPPPGALPAWSPRTVADYPEGAAAFAAAGAAHVAAQREALRALYGELGVPVRFGSFAAVVPLFRTDDLSPLLLGAPQMGAPSPSQPSVTSEVVLDLGGNVILAGMTVPGIPGVIIGRTFGLSFLGGGAWTLTTGYTDNTDTYLEALDATGQQYLFEGELRPFEVLTSEIGVAGAESVSHTTLRSVHGPVYFLDADAGLAATWKYAFWNRELDMVEALYALWTTAEDEASVEDALRDVPMSFNFLWASAFSGTAYWHLGRYPERPASADPRLPLSGTGEDEWVGTLPFDAHPKAIDPAEPLANWNNKPAPWWPQGDNVDWTANPPGGYARTYDGVVFLQDHLAASGQIDTAELKELFRIVRSNGTYNEYPGTYQQVLGGFPCSSDFGLGALTVSPPGQSAFLALEGGQPVPADHTADQWTLYQSSASGGEIEMKNLFLNTACPSAEPGAGSGAIELGRPAPNPVAGTTTLRFTLAQPADVRLSVVDALGREVVVLAAAPHAAGEHAAELDTSGLTPGLYVVRLAAGDHVASQRVVVAR